MEIEMGRRPFRPNKPALLRRIDSWLAHAIADAELIRESVGDGVVQRLIADTAELRARFRALRPMPPTLNSN